ncbi:MAG TPA: hypothetical protein VK064_03070 [Wenzhouxiangella sp.]|nr:hypothetical protein [Wenzhouxiangella sp.]
MSARPWFVVMACGLVACVVALLLDASTFAFAWLAATLTWGLLPLGALAALMTAGLAGGGWSELSRGPWRALAACLPLFALALLPLLLFARGALFPWTQPVEELPEIVTKKLLYLNVPFFSARTVAYFVVWLLLAFLMGVWHPTRRGGAVLCAAGLLALLYTLSFFAFDWLLSLEPKFYTDVFGLWLADTMVAGAAALVLLALGGTGDSVFIARRADLANLWLAVLLGWLFLAFAQYIVVWSGNIPHEIGWFVHRMSGGWAIMLGLVFLCLFALPFLALLFRWVKRHGHVLQWVAVAALVGYVLQVQWWILPSAQARAWQLAWMAPVCVITLGGALAGCWLLFMQRQQEEVRDGRD